MARRRDKREAPISYRPPAALAAEFAARVRASGLSTNAFITSAVFGSPSLRAAPRPSMEHKELARLHALVCKALDELAAIKAAHPDDPAIDELCAAAQEVIAEFGASWRNAMGRRP